MDIHNITLTVPNDNEQSESEVLSRVVFALEAEFGEGVMLSIMHGR